MAAIQSISKYSDLELALMGFLGWIGNGQDRVNLLGSRYNAVQGIINQIINTDTVPAGTTAVNKDQIRKAVLSTFNDIINEVSEEIVNEIK
jgi:hypothetical protein